jgi:tol-pal system protein YbgF
MTQLRAARLLAPLLALAFVLAPARPAFAVNKDMVQLQTQVQQLLDAVARLQQSNDERMGVLKDLVQQNADSVNKLSVSVATLERQLATQQTAQGSKIDTVSGQMQALNDSIDELKARMNRLEKVLGDVNNQTQSISAQIQSQPQSFPQGAAQPPSSLGSGAQPGTAPLTPGSPIPAPGSSLPPTGSRGKPSAAIPPAPANGGAIPVKDLYQAGLGDYMAARYPVAASEFGEVIRTYPDDPLSGNAFYYLGEIEYRNAKFSSAVRDYDKVLEQFPDSSKTPVAHLHKGEALLQMKETEAGIRELRALIQRFPTSPEATQARSKLNGMGVPIKPRT